MSQPKIPSPRSNIAVLYVLLLLGGLLALWGVRTVGLGLNAPPPPPDPASVVGSSSEPHRQVDVVLHVLATLAAVIALGNLISIPLKRLGQPPVIGEIVAGILLGPSALGAVAPDAMHLLIPDRASDPQGLVRASLITIAQLGIVLYMFLVGLELNTHKLKHQARAAIAVSLSGMLIPFVAGSVLALWLYPLLSNSSVEFSSFALFLGVAMSITAFPVLARILAERRLEKSDLGVLALGSAATSDVVAWCLLAFVVGIVQSKLGDALSVAIWTTLFVAAMFLIVRPIIVGFSSWSDRQSTISLPVAALFVAVLATAMATDVIGIHAVFGPFLLGAIIPHDSRIARELSHKLHDVVTVLLLPAFFAMTGMNTKIGLISGWDNWLLSLAIILVATAGKFGGTLLAARWTGYDWCESSALGILMNTRGLMELIVLDIGVGLGVISPTLFAMMVLMAIGTTIITSPILGLILERHPQGEPKP